MPKPITSYEHIQRTPDSDAHAMAIVSNTTERLKDRSVIAIAGESGSGKSTISLSLVEAFKSVGKRALILHIDNYFKLSPKLNQQKRREDASYLGLSEINLPLLQEHVHQFKGWASFINIPILSANRSEFVKHKVSVEDVDVLLVEGTFAFELDQIDLKVFLDFNYKHTRFRRITRGRDTIDDFTEQVLQKEHELISPYKKSADVLVNSEGISQMGC